MNLKNGTLLKNGTYRIERALGHGTFGITYLATAKYYADGNLGRREVEMQVAIKEFFMDNLNTRSSNGSRVEGSSGTLFINYRKKFRKEAENLGKLSHPHIVKIFDVFDENDTSYYVMEYLGGTNLDDYIKFSGRINENEAISIISQIGAALDYMHSNKMLHLDVKPKNVMHSHNSFVHLIDFGLSKQYSANDEPETSTTIGLGTPGYAPLEQGQGKKDGTFPVTVDVYALGATLFKMLTGMLPPEATVVLNDGFPREELIRAGVSLPTAKAIEKAMSPAKRNRYQSVNEFIRVLAENKKANARKEEATRVADSSTYYSRTVNESPGPRTEKSYSSSERRERKFNRNIESEEEPVVAVQNDFWYFLKERNSITSIGLVLGCLWFIFNIARIVREVNPTHEYSSYQFALTFTLFAALLSLFGTIRLFLNLGTGKYLPLIGGVICCGIIFVKFYGSLSCFIASVFPYLAMLIIMNFEKDGVKASKLLNYTHFSRNHIKKFWKNSNKFVLVALCLLTLMSTAVFFIGWMWILERANSVSLVFIIGFGSIAAGSLIMVLGYKTGCWLFWFGICFILGLTYNQTSIQEGSVFILIAIAVQGLFFITKKGKSAISVMG